MLAQDNDTRTFIINLDNNKPPSGPNNKDVVDALNRLASNMGYQPVWEPRVQTTPPIAATSQTQSHQEGARAI